MLGGGDEGRKVSVNGLDMRKHGDYPSQQQRRAGAHSVEDADKRQTLPM